MIVGLLASFVFQQPVNNKLLAIMNSREELGRSLGHASDMETHASFGQHVRDMEKNDWGIEQTSQIQCCMR